MTVVLSKPRADEIKNKCHVYRQQLHTFIKKKINGNVFNSSMNYT